ncbi:hypothetical protein RR46_03908 [Papilio xuthus]|uniref:Uncharacterized protein n=1 Tax=Papilio xuthus TaxID=66420 RepID=A0A194Q2H9_PAPXU|nr:hypothetical protein RR46_03908 [Papilio xuthus]
MCFHIFDPNPHPATSPRATRHPPLAAGPPRRNRAATSPQPRLNLAATATNPHALVQARSRLSTPKTITIPTTFCYQLIST